MIPSYLVLFIYYNHNLEVRKLKKIDEKVEPHSSNFVDIVYEKPYSTILSILFVIWCGFQLYFSINTSLDAVKFRAYHIIFLLVFTFLLFPKQSVKNGIKNRFKISNVLIAFISVLSFGYFIAMYPKIVMSGGVLSKLDLVVAFICIVLVIYAGFRTSRNLTILVLLFLLYLYFGKFINGALGHSGFTLRRVLNHMVWGSQGIFGVGVGVSASYIYLFVVFGAFLKESGFSKLVNDVSLGLVGKTPGGPAKVAVLSSMLLGMINGSAIANVATTGTITIPMMKEAGYKKEYAAAVEAVASTGGQFCPPVMGAVGFIMAEYLGIPYSKVMIAAALPAFLYYFGIMVSVHMEAKRLGLKGVEDDEIPDMKKVLREQGHLSIPLFVLIILIIMKFSPIYAAVAAIFASIVSAGLKKETRMSLSQIKNAIIDGSMSAISVGISCVLIGLIIGTVSLTSLGLNFGNVILQISQNTNLLFTGVLVMIMSIILGMGVPGVAAYVIVAAVSAPVLIKSGAVPIAAHMFCLIYACLSNITPPVAMSSYIASGIAKSDETKTSIIAVKLGITGFLFPLFFLINPILLIGAVEGASAILTLRTLITASIGVFALACSMEGMFVDRCTKLERVLLLGIGLLAIDPGIVTDLIGIAILLSMAMVQKRRSLSFE
ncbi:MAG: TRAP transporter fused permease subunit [Tissierellia bacterium]|nr:TRAP transporter fused permease subunit [Tissierellia bacterium]